MNMNMQLILIFLGIIALVGLIFFFFMYLYATAQAAVNKAEHAKNEDDDPFPWMAGLTYVVWEGTTILALALGWGNVPVEEIPASFPFFWLCMLIPAWMIVLMLTKVTMKTFYQHPEFRSWWRLVPISVGPPRCQRVHRLFN